MALATPKSNVPTIGRSFLPSRMLLDAKAPYIDTPVLVAPSLYCGVELELENCAYALPSSGGTDVVGDLELKHGILAHADGSLRNGGIELVTKPVRGGALVEQIHYICSLAKLKRWKPSNRAGLHVHIDVQGLTFDKYLELVALYILLEPCFFQPGGKERSGSIYCKPWYNTDTTPLRRFVLDMRQGVFSAPPSRYYGLNVGSTGKHGTLEFRHMPSTTDPAAIIKWVNQIGALYNYAVNNPITPVMVRSATPDGLMQAVFGSHEYMDPEFPSYFYHGCVPSYFDIFGDDPPSSLSWKRGTANKGHKGFEKFVAGRSKPTDTRRANAYEAMFSPAMWIEGFTPTTLAEFGTPMVVRSTRYISTAAPSSWIYTKLPGNESLVTNTHSPTKGLGGRLFLPHPTRSDLYYSHATPWESARPDNDGYVYIYGDEV